jgi:DNA-directed RNA polymerase specialized sigma24 family protein
LFFSGNDRIRTFQSFPFWNKIAFFVDIISLKTERPYSDPEFIALLKQQDMQAYDYLFEKYAGALHGLISQILPGPDHVAAVLEESFRKIAESIDNYDPSKYRLFTWMMQLTRETALQKLRSENIRISSASLTTGNPGTGIGQITMELDEEQQQLIEMSYFKGYSVEDVAKHLNIPPETAKTKIKAALLKLRSYN